MDSGITADELAHLLSLARSAVKGRKPKRTELVVPLRFDHQSRASKQIKLLGPHWELATHCRTVRFIKDAGRYRKGTTMERHRRLCLLTDGSLVVASTSITTSYGVVEAAFCLDWALVGDIRQLDYKESFHEEPRNDKSISEKWEQGHGVCRTSSEKPLPPGEGFKAALQKVRTTPYYKSLDKGQPPLGTEGKIYINKYRRVIDNAIKKKSLTAYALLFLSVAISILFGANTVASIAAARALDWGGNAPPQWVYTELLEGYSWLAPIPLILLILFVRKPSIAASTIAASTAISTIFLLVAARDLYGYWNSILSEAIKNILVDPFSLPFLTATGGLAITLAAVMLFGFILGIALIYSSIHLRLDAVTQSNSIKRLRASNRKLSSWV